MRALTRPSATINKHNMLTRFFISTGLAFFDAAHLIQAANTAEAFIWAALSLSAVTVMVLTAYDLQNEH